MSSRTKLWIGTALRGLQILFGVIVLGNSATLAKGFYDGMDSRTQSVFSRVPFILPWASAVGALTFIAGGVNIFIAWTDHFSEFIEMIVDIVIMFGNIVAGTLLSVRVMGKNCNDESDENRFGPTKQWPYTGGLAAVDIFRGACYDNADTRVCLNSDMPERYIWLNKRCKQSNADAAVVWLTVALLIGTLTLTYLRRKQDR